MIRADIEDGGVPIVGSEKQSEGDDPLSAPGVRGGIRPRSGSPIFSENPSTSWWGRTLNAKVKRMPEDAREKLRETLQRIINEGSGGPHLHHSVTVCKQAGGGGNPPPACRHSYEFLGGEGPALRRRMFPPPSRRGGGLPLPLSGSAVFCLTPRRAGTPARPSPWTMTPVGADDSARRASQVFSLCGATSLLPRAKELTRKVKPSLKIRGLRSGARGNFSAGDGESRRPTLHFSHRSGII